MDTSKRLIRFLAIAMAVLACCFTFAQEPTKQEPPRRPAFHTTPNDTVVSPEVLPDKRVTFRLYAPEAKAVKLTGEWVSSLEESKKMEQGIDLQAGADGVWSVTVGPLLPGTFRYNFLVDGTLVSDPRNPDSSQALNFVRGMVSIPGLDYQDVQDVPHGAVTSVMMLTREKG